MQTEMAKKKKQKKKSHLGKFAVLVPTAQRSRMPNLWLCMSFINCLRDWQKGTEKTTVRPFSHKNTAGRRDNNDALLMHSSPVFGALGKEFTAPLETTHKVKLQIKLGGGQLLFQMNYGPLLLADEQMWIKKKESHKARSRVWKRKSSFAS